MSLYQIISGPMVWVSFVLFIVGTIFQIIQLYPSIKRSMTHLNVISYSGAKREEKLIVNTKKLSIKKLFRHLPDFNSLIYKLAMLKYSLFGRYPLTMFITTLFHLLLIFSPFLVLGHNVLFESALGVSFPSLSSEVSTILTLIVIFCCLYFLIRRLTIPLVKSITTRGDYIMLAIAVAPFLTGFMAHHQIFNYTLMIHLHILAGEIMLISIPFTKFIHMIYFIIVRVVLMSNDLRIKELKI
ncbi:MAG: hypothetical protein HQK72_08110 [Desulfamplus sp.]|nr:hypothetical protein [Desulfamplus sp.]